MYIQSNKMLSPTSRIIKPYMCSMLATEGPNILGKLNLSGVEIPYDSQYVTRLTLNPGAADQPLMYGFLGNNVTFLLLKITYDENDPKCIIEENQYIEYWFKDEPGNIRYMNKLLLLTGNSIKRIPQIYLSNPSTVKVYVDVMMANLDQSDLTEEDINNEIMKIYNLYNNSIISDTFWNSTGNISGSTQLQVLNIDNRVVAYIDYDEIYTIEQDTDNYELIITTKSDTIIHLSFLSLFEMYQANSRINWVMKTSLTRYLTKDLPPVDIESPVIIMNSGITPLILPNIYSYPVSGTNFTIYPDDVLNYFIRNINDNRDGVIAVTDASIVLRKEGYVEHLTGITQTGVYDIVITVGDIANNVTYANYIIIVDNVPPVITFNQGITTGFTMTIPDDTRVPADGITKDDIIRKTIYNVIDDVDGIIANSAITIQIVGITRFTSITQPGQYTVIFNVSDRAGNIASYTKYMLVTGDIIIGSGQTFTLNPTITTASFIFNGGSGSSATMIISGYSFLISNSGGNLVWDYSGLTEHVFTYSGETYVVTINNTLFNITFTKWGSFYFSITNIGSAPNINLSFVSEYRLSSQSGYTDSGITNSGINYLINLDNDSNSVFNIKSNNIESNFGTIQNTAVYLQSFTLNDNTSGVTTGTTSGTSLYDYYVNKYPTFNLLQLDEILLGELPIAYLFEHDGNIVIDDTISSDVINSFVMFGDYPKGTYNFKYTLIDIYSHYNVLYFNYIVN